MSSKTYFIKEGYQHRLSNDFCDDTGKTDTWQKEVYLFAKKIALANNFTSVLDIGTGSAYKLLQNFSDYDTLGIDLPPTVSWLKSKYPDRKWTANFLPVQGYDLAIASDVIEHLPDPDLLLDLIENSKPKLVIFSTPDRDLLRRSPDGPPKNTSHCREWTSLEFNQYISSRFKVLQQFTSSRGQATQVVLAELKK